MPKGKKGFQPGESGNKSGRPKGYADFAARCRELADESGFKVLSALLRSDDETIRLNASKFIVERGYGKSLENVRVGMDDDLATLLQSARARMKE